LGCIQDMNRSQSGHTTSNLFAVDSKTFLQSEQ
jgi:hypothetical protein